MTKEIGKEKKWIITFSNGYCGCDTEEEFEGTYDEAVDFANEYLPDYAEQYAHAAFGWEEEYTEEEYEEYIEDCGYEIEESEDEEEDD
jgi:hypothetical protein